MVSRLTLLQNNIMQDEINDSFYQPKNAVNLISNSRFTVNKVNFFLEVENNSNNVETKFHGRRISIDEVIKSINVNFLFFRSIFFYYVNFCFLAFFARFYFILKKR